MLTRRFSRDSIDATNGKPRVVRVVLCDNHGYLTFAGECGCSVQHDYDRFAVVGTTYGWLHNTAGDIRFWQSESGARHALKAYVGEDETLITVPPLECVHADTCTPDFWSGHRLPHVQIPVYKGMHLAEVKYQLRSELSQGCVSGNDPLTRDDSGEAGDRWYKRAHAAVNRIQPATKGKRRMFEELEPVADDDDSAEMVYAFFVFVEKE